MTHAQQKIDPTADAPFHRWSDVPADSPIAMLTRQRIGGRNMMVQRVVLQKGCIVPSHSHDNEQFTCVISGRLRLDLYAGTARPVESVEVGPGDVLVLPAGVPHGAEALEDTVVLDSFSPPSAATGIDVPKA